MKTLESIISNAETAAASATGAARYDLLNIAQMAREELAKVNAPAVGEVATSEPVVILSRQTENSFALQFHEAELLVMPAQGGDDFTSDEQAALQGIVRACNAHAAMLDAVRLAGRNAESRLYMLPLDAHESERKQLEVEVATHSAALKSATA